MLILSSIAIRRTYLRYEASFRRRMRFGRFTWWHYLIFKYAYLIVICILNSDVGEKEKERERAVTEMRHIIAVRGTLSRHLTECKCTSGISRFNHERVYTFVLLYWLRYITLATYSQDRPIEDDLHFYSLCLKINERCVSHNAVMTKCEQFVYKININSLFVNFENLFLYVILQINLRIILEKKF